MRRRPRKSEVASVLSLLALGAGCGPTPDDRSWVVRMSHVYPVASDYQLMAERLHNLMEERTGGRFRVVIYPGGQLGGERVAFEQIQIGAVHMAISGTPVLSGWVPEGQIFDLPFLFETRDHGLEVLNGCLGDWWRALLLERTGVRSLGFLDYGFRHVYNRKRPIQEPSDLSGLKLRVLENPTYLATYAAFDAQATPMSYGEVYSALQQGVIDGGEANLVGFVTDRFYEISPYFSFTSITYNPITLLVNERFFQSLPADVRHALETSARESLAYQSDVVRRMEVEALAQMRRAHVIVTHPDLERFKAVVRPGVWRALAERLPDGEALLKRLEEALRSTGASPTRRGQPQAVAFRTGPKPPL